MNSKRLAFLGFAGAVAFGGMTATSTDDAEAKPRVVRPGTPRALPRARPKATITSHTVKLRDITKPLVPYKVLRGDREFGGNGPLITCSAELMPSSDKRSILAKIDFRAVETGGDRSTTEHRWYERVYTAPRGKTISKIVSPTRSSVRFTSVRGGFQFLVPGTDTRKFFLGLSQLADKIEEAERKLAMRIAASERRELNAFLQKVREAKAFMPFQGNHVHTVAPRSGPVEVFAIVGDTGGDDISDDTNPKDDTRIQAITFKNVRVQLQ